MIHFSQVFKRYANGFDALKHISLVIPTGSITFLTGHSGAGKSTLLKLISLTELATRGQVVVNNQDLSKLRGNSIARHRRNIGYVFQDHKLLMDRNVEDNVALPLIVAGTAVREYKRRTSAALDKVGLLNLSKRMPITLSAGEQQRVGIARAVVGRPDFLLADEPTGNLDPALADEIMNLFFLFSQYNVTVIIATHDYRHLDKQGAGLLALEKGHIVRDSYS
jgi:cell division transport system ATP-binding protein